MFGSAYFSDSYEQSYVKVDWMENYNLVLKVKLINTLNTTKIRKNILLKIKF